jgi:predicted RecB family endonuclease
VKRLLEESIEGDVKRFVEAKGYDVYRQVQVLGRRIDILGVREGSMLAVELKVRDWKYAIYQAYLASLCASKVYVALPNATIHLANPNVFVENGIGLLSVNGNVEVVVEARELNNVHKTLQNRIAESLKSNSEMAS